MEYTTVKIDLLKIRNFDTHIVRRTYGSEWRILAFRSMIQQGNVLMLTFAVEFKGRKAFDEAPFDANATYSSIYIRFDTRDTVRLGAGEIHAGVCLGYPDRFAHVVVRIPEVKEEKRMNGCEIVPLCKAGNINTGHKGKCDHYEPSQCRRPLICANFDETNGSCLSEAAIKEAEGENHG